MLILSLATGEGHNSAARALAEECRARGDECTVLDAYRSTSLFAYGIVRMAYFLASGAMHREYGFFYRYSERAVGNRFYAALARFHNGNLARRMKGVIEREKPDAVIFTHVFCGQILEALRRRGQLSVPAVGVLTDFTVHPRWERFPSLGALVTPHGDISKIALSRGYAPECLFPLGIPIHPKYKSRRTKQEARQLLGLPADESIVLLMSGSTGYGAAVRYVKEADRASHPFRILSVSGRNRKNFKKISRLRTEHPLTAVGFSDQIELLMDAADLLVTKPGGLSSAEALSRGLPMILTEPIPGHEVRNEEFLLSHGAALSLSHPRELAPLIDHLLGDEEQLESLARAALALGRPEAAAEAVDLAHRLRASGKEGSPLPETAP